MSKNVELQSKGNTKVKVAGVALALSMLASPLGASASVVDVEKPVDGDTPVSVSNTAEETLKDAVTEVAAEKDEKDKKEGEKVKNKFKDVRYTNTVESLEDYGYKNAKVGDEVVYKIYVAFPDTVHAPFEKINIESAIPSGIEVEDVEMVSIGLAKATAVSNQTGNAVSGGVVFDKDKFTEDEVREYVAGKEIYLQVTGKVKDDTYGQLLKSTATVSLDDQSKETMEVRVNVLKQNGEGRDDGWIGTGRPDWDDSDWVIVGGDDKDEDKDEDNDGDKDEDKDKDEDNDGDKDEDKDGEGDDGAVDDEDEDKKGDGGSNSQDVGVGFVPGDGYNPNGGSGGGTSTNDNNNVSTNDSGKNLPQTGYEDKVNMSMFAGLLLLMAGAGESLRRRFKKEEEL